MTTRCSKRTEINSFRVIVRALKFSYRINFYFLRRTAINIANKTKTTTMVMIITIATIHSLLSLILGVLVVIVVDVVLNTDVVVDVDVDVVTGIYITP